MKRFENVRIIVGLLAQQHQLLGKLARSRIVAPDIRIVPEAPKRLETPVEVIDRAPEFLGRAIDVPNRGALGAIDNGERRSKLQQYAKFAAVPLFALGQLGQLLESIAVACNGLDIAGARGRPVSASFQIVCRLGGQPRLSEVMRE